MNLLVTGHTSTIAKELIASLKRKKDVRVFSVGRDKSSDFYCDFSKYESIKKFIDESINDININFAFLNHGVLLGKRATDLSEIEIYNYMLINQYSYIMLLEKLCLQENLNIVTMSSISGKEGSFDSLYASTKAGVDSFRYKAKEILPPSSRLNFISPGVISDARMTTSRKDVENVEKARLNTPSKSLSNSKEVSQLVSKLLFNPGNINLQDFALNGGASLNR